eukprot:COSAG02_NODE_17434_length_1004_cov_0.713812_1_plen_201_part_10
MPRGLVFAVAASLLAATATATAAATAPPPPPPACPVSPSDPWHGSSGCCCCTGACLFAGCPPCPCPSPQPGKKQPQCSLAKLNDAFVKTYTAVVAKTKPADYPAKTAADASGHWGWAYQSGWTSGFYPGLLWQLANATGDASFKTAAAAATAGREVEKTETTGHDIGMEGGYRDAGATAGTGTVLACPVPADCRLSAPPAP